ncbi:MAG: hypothetical protein OEV42_19840 [Deltaproteobacteria bacterium]|nr:hypothetical protein [Deltaproteobacteria bacterium]
MNQKLLQEHIKNYIKRLSTEDEKQIKEREEHSERVKYYQEKSKDKILKMDADEFYEYIAKLWAMLIWGNKQYVVDKLIQDNGFERLKEELAELLWGTIKIDTRWDRFRKNIKGMGPAMMSELLCHVHPNECMIWNRRAYVGLNHLGFENLPRYDYQVSGEKYVELTQSAKLLVEDLKKAGITDPSLLVVDYFIWDELQVEEKLSKIHSKEVKGKTAPGEIENNKASEFIHDEVKEKLKDIGRWLGFDADTEKKVAHGSIVDTVWEATIGNMGKVIYVFEVQTKGNIDSLIVNLQQALNNSAVQGVVAVSDAAQIEKIKKRTATIEGLNKKLKFWDYEEVLNTAGHLEAANESINQLGLVPESF